MDRTADRCRERMAGVRQWFAAGVIGCLLLLPVQAVADGQPQAATQRPRLQLPDELSAALAENARNLSPVSVSWTMTYTTERDMDEARAIGRFTEGGDFFEPRHVQFHRDHNRFRYWMLTWRHAGKRRDAYWFHSLSDGTNLYHGNLRGDQLNAVAVDYVAQPVPREATSIVFIAEYFERAGFKLHSVRNQIERPDMSMLLYLLDRQLTLREVAEETVDGRDCTVVKVSSTGKNRLHVFYFDPALGHALRRYEQRTLDGTPVQITVNSDFAEFTNPSIWLPRRSQTDWYTWVTIAETILEEPLVQEQIEVTELSKEDIAPETFLVDLKQPQLWVADSRLPGADERETGRIDYIVPANLDLLEGVIDAAVAGKEYEPPLTSHRTRMALIAVNILIFAAAGLVFCLRRS